MTVAYACLGKQAPSARNRAKRCTDFARIFVLLAPSGFAHTYFDNRCGRARRIRQNAEQCHGATTMTDGILLTDESSTKASMWGGFRCNRAFVVLLLLNVIAFQSLVCECSTFVVLFSSLSSHLVSSQCRYAMRHACDGMSESKAHVNTRTTRF